MNKAILMGRLTKDPEVRYSQSAEPVAVTRYTLAVNRRFKRDGEPDADFINCVAFGKAGEFVGNYFKKGQMVSVIGSIRVRSYDDQSGQRRWITEVITDEHYFAESKASFEANRGSKTESDSALDYYSQMPQGQAASGEPSDSPSGFTAITESIDDDDLPF